MGWISHASHYNEGLEVTLKKPGSDSLKVNALQVTFASRDVSKQEIFTFTCGLFDLSEGVTEYTTHCKNYMEDKYWTTK